MKKTLPILVSALLCAATSAQNQQADFLVAGPPNATTDVGGGIFLVDLANDKSTILANLPADLRRTSCLLQDPTNPLQWYAGTYGPVKNVPGPVHIYSFTASAGRVLTSSKLNTDNMTSDTEIKAMALAGDKIVFGSDSRVGTIPLGGGSTTTLFSFTNPSGNFPAIACDGRYLYTNIHNTGNGYRTGGGSVWRHDLQDLTKRVSLFSVDQFPTNILGLEVDGEGNLYSVDKGNFASPKYRVHDLLTGTRTRDVTLPWMSLRSPMSIGVDPATDTAVINGQGVTGFSDQNFYSVIVRGAAVGTPFGGVDHAMSAVAARRTPGLVRRGFECASSASPEYMPLAKGTPNVSNTGYALELYGPANAVAILMIGPGVAFPPVKLAPTNCELGLNPTLLLSGVIPANQRLSVPLPIPANAANFVVDSQWAVLESGANALGIVTRQVGRIYVR